MPLTRIEIEEQGGSRWTAEVEIGGLTAWVAKLSAQSFDDILTAAIRAHDQRTGVAGDARIVRGAGTVDIAALQSELRQARADREAVAKARDEAMREVARLTAEAAAAAKPAVVTRAERARGRTS